ncbi:hydroxyacylglutathione hydrolase, mitochondrial isoform X1 [Rhizophagus irregularis DAOM 181602=DAOM 197198]|uniref:hydroxyacylglutathione hydrolase n=3 Tax=Rhizophagus irregularis TaxID=588596 RepID=A0A015N0F8_RHIIW|nr:hydroxyacylglutathione hydrolase GLO2 [Rhizophagus irregularis DAOM 197198w]GBC24091.2 hydroxyacylglutathione hydrolase, mitochondrial isoform X1 [Rhizophagus irregularis DAOM 181602=DAOM 197198]
MLRSGLKILSKKSVNYMWTNKKRMIFQTVCNNMKVIPIPVLQDNYSYLVIDEKTNEAAVVDPAEPEKVLEVVKNQGVNLKHLITTHHHVDHSGGNTKLVDEKPDLIVYGGDDRIPSVNKIVKDNEEFKIGQIDVKALFTICHTSGSVSFYLQDENDKAVFTGDTLFIGGCGRFFEGTAEQMHNSLNNILAKLPKDTKVYCGHEYTKSNLKFAASVEPDNEFLKQKIQWANENERTVPSTIGDELEFNPFMRVDKESIKKATSKQSPVEVMAALRELKNKF